MFLSFFLLLLFLLLLLLLLVLFSSSVPFRISFVPRYWIMFTLCLRHLKESIYHCRPIFHTQLQRNNATTFTPESLLLLWFLDMLLADCLIGRHISVTETKAVLVVLAFLLEITCGSTLQKYIDLILHFISLSLFLSVLSLSSLFPLIFSSSIFSSLNEFLLCVFCASVVLVSFSLR